MHFALIDGKLTGAMPGLKGHCLGCAAPMIAKCGDQRMHHWAHQNRPVCDNWWETETVWHRSWKENFPRSWQEAFLKDELTGDMHIADILTDYGYIIEFQHSHITPEERNSRERFYKNMVWVVDGTRLKRDHARFLRKQKKFSRTDNNHIFHVQDPEECFPASWDNIRLQDIRLSYQFNRSNYPRLPVKGILFYTYANNIAILWRANKLGLDPDYGQSLPAVRTIAFGCKIDL